MNQLFKMKEVLRSLYPTANLISISFDFSSYQGECTRKEEIVWTLYIANEGNTEFPTFEALQEYVTGLVNTDDKKLESAFITCIGAEVAR